MLETGRRRATKKALNILAVVLPDGEALRKSNWQNGHPDLRRESEQMMKKLRKEADAFKRGSIICPVCECEIKIRTNVFTVGIAESTI